MTNAITLSFNDTPTRVIDREGQPWFLGMDIVPVLGLTNAGMAYSKLDGDERCYISRTDLGLPPGRQMTLISESGLYKLAMRSDKKSAKPFQDWVTKVVLPAIRKDGGYVMGEEKVVTGEMSEDELVLKAIEVMQAKVTRLREENVKLKSDNDALTLLAAVGARSVAHDHTLNRFMRTLSGVNTLKIKGDLKAHNYLYKIGGCYRVYARFNELDAGRAGTKSALAAVE